MILPQSSTVYNEVDNRTLEISSVSLFINHVSKIGSVVKRYFTLTEVK